MYPLHVSAKGLDIMVLTILTDVVRCSGQPSSDHARHKQGVIDGRLMCEDK